MQLMNIVEFTKIRKALRKLPSHIVSKLRFWAQDVETYGILQIRKLPGYHDEPLKGKRKGQRSIRLSRSYRAIYTESKKGEIHLITIEEVSKHEY
mgnify:CR=1 FL=1